MIEYSTGYQDKARQKLNALDSAFTPKARFVARNLTMHFEEASTKQETEEREDEPEAA